MLLRNLQDRATGRRVLKASGVPRANEGIDGGPLSIVADDDTTTLAAASSSPSFANSLAASADLAPRLRVVSTCDGHEAA